MKTKKTHRRGVAKVTTMVAGAVLLLVASALPAQASHYRGVTAVIEVELAGDELAIEITSQWRKGSADGYSSLDLLNAADRSFVQTISLPRTVDTTSPFHDVATNTATVDISGLPNGDYLLYGESCCRISGITNVGANSFSLEAKFAKDGTNGGPPVMRSNMITAIGVGYEYSQNLNAVDPDGGTLTYEFLTDESGPEYGAPMFPGLSISPKGQIIIPATTTAGYSDGQLHVYKVRVTDSQGEYIDRDVMLTAFETDNIPPVITDLDNEITLTAGETTVVEFTAPDANVDQTVTLTASGLPDFATLDQTPGNPAAGTLTFTPTVDDIGTTSGFNVDATDDDPEVPFTDSEFVEVTVVAPPTTTTATTTTTTTTTTVGAVQPVVAEAATPVRAQPTFTG